MIARQLFVKIAMLLSCGMAFAAPGTKYFNLAESKVTSGSPVATKVSYVLYLHQEAASCTKGGTYGEGTCLGSVEATPEKLYTLLKEQWVNHKGVKEGSSPSLTFATDIDLGEFTDKTEAGKCVKNHVALPSLSGVAITGNNKKIKNLCYVSNDPMTSPMGFFESVDGTNVGNLTIENVRMAVGGSNDGADYYPMGAFAGVASLSTINNVNVTNVDIQGPIAGSIVGLLSTSTLRNINSNSKIVVSNNVSITNGYAGSNSFEKVSNHNVFLGGLAGVVLRNDNPKDPSLDNVYASVTVKDLAKGHNSAVGGAVGLYSTIGESITGVKIGYKPVSTNCTMWGCTLTDEEVPAEISGGSSMGGLFGAMAVYYENNSPVRGNFAMKNAAFKGSISNAAVTAVNDQDRVIAVGGLVGLDSIVAGMSVSIDGGVADVEIVDSLQITGNYYYYAGGIVGYGGEGACTNGSGDPSDFLAISNAKSSGSINVKASGADVEGLRVQSFVGGIAGAACLAQKEGSFEGNSSSMDIAMNMKTSTSGNPINVYDTLMVGGIAGYVNTGIANSALNIAKDVFSGSIAVEDSLNTTIIGGIVGGMLQRGFEYQGNGHLISFNSVKVENKNVIDYKTNSKEKPVYAMIVPKVGGVCGFCSEFQTMDLAEVKGSIKVSGNFAGDSMVVGGLAGKLYASDNVLPSISRTYVNGDILVSTVTPYKKAGYMIGTAAFFKGCTAKSNYHYGANDAVVSKPAGELYKGIDVSDGWMTNPNVSYTVRNGDEENLDATQNNGYVLASYMKTDDFLEFLRTPYGSMQNMGWVRLDGKNDDMPYVEAGAKGCAAEAFEVKFVDMDLSVVESKCVESGKTVELYDTTNVTSLDSLHCSGWRILSGKDTTDFVATTPITANTTLYAKYSLNKYKVVFKKSAGEDGEVVSGPMYVAHGTNVPFPSLRGINMDSTGYEFVGWKDSAAVAYVTKNLEIVAVYEAQVSYYTYLYENGDFYTADTVTYPDVRKEIAGPEKIDETGVYEYTFKAWTSVDSDEYVGNVYRATYDQKKIVYTIVFVDKEGKLFGDTLKLNYGDKITYPVDVEREGQKFVGWSSGAEFVTKSDVIVAFYLPVETSGNEDSTSEPVVAEKELISNIASIHQQEYSKAIKLEFSLKDLDSAEKTEVTLTLHRVGSEDSVVKVMTFENVSKVDSSWEVILSVAGDYYVTLDVVNGNVSDSDQFEFKVASEIVVAQNSWNMFGVSTIKSQKMNGTLYWWDEANPVGDYWQYKAFNSEKIADVEDTRGFWYGTTDGTPLVLRDVENCKDSEIVWDLKNAYSGWNLVANPCAWSLDLTKGEAESGEKLVFQKWDPEKGSYDPVTEIEPFGAVWVNVKKSTTWRMPSAPTFVVQQATSAEKKRSLLKSALRKTSSKSWAVMAVLSDKNGKSDYWNILGAGATAETREEAPAGMGDYVNLSVIDGKKALNKSVKAIADEYEWTLNVNATSAREGQLSFEGVEDLQAAGLRLFVTVDGVTSEVQSGESVKVALTKSSKQVGVRVASAPKAIAVASQISGFRAMKVAGDLQMQFETTSDLAGAASHYALVDVKGKVVASGNFSASAGNNSISVAAPKAGVYFMKLKVGSQMSSSKVLVK